MTLFSATIYFFLYSFLGWILDTGMRSYETMEYSPGSLFPVPFCPIYAVGVFLVLYTYRLVKDLPYLFQWVFYTFLLGLLELVSGVVTSAILGRHLWYYHDTFLNIAGHTDLFHAASWGVLAVFTATHMHPFFENFLFKGKKFFSR